MKVIKGINDLKTYCEQNDRADLLKEWDYKENYPLKPDDVYFMSVTKVSWNCEKCGNHWMSSVGNRLRGHGCKICGFKRISETKKKTTIGKDDLVTLYPDVAKEWDYDKNYPYTPYEVKPNSEKIKPWWLCPKGHSYQASLTNRTHLHSGCPYCAGKKVLSGFNDLQSKYPLLAAQWDKNKNKGLSPEQITSASSKKVWWICPKGHSYQATPCSRTINNTDCPICSGARATSLPEQAILFYLSKYYKTKSRHKIDNKEADIYLPSYKIAIEYDGMYYHSAKDVAKRDRTKALVFQKKGILLLRIKETRKERNVTKDTISYDRRKGYSELDWVITKLFELLNELTHNNFVCFPDFEKDRMKIIERYRNYEKKNNLAITNPELVEEWNYEKNGKIMPMYYTQGSSEKVWWKCNAGHEWNATIASRAQGHGCPYCSGMYHITGINDLASSNPEIAKEWDYDKNGEITPDKVAKATHKKYWWICPKGHSYQASPLNRTTTNHSGCPYCSNKKVLIGYNDLESKFPQLAKEWDYEKNEPLKPIDVAYGSYKKAFWKCQNCGHVWNCRVLERKNGRKCPNCHFDIGIAKND